MAPFVLLSMFFALFSLVWATKGLDRRDDDHEFVTVHHTEFFIRGKLFYFYGSVPYWVNMLSDSELDTTFNTIAAAGITVARIWAFNDVSEKPATGTYLQILADGQATLNTGADGLERLDSVVESARRAGIKLIMSLTNNWNPERPQQASALARRGRDFPRGFLSNDYGGMDMYVRAFHPGGTHDLFYTDPTIIEAFKAYVSKVVTRFADSSTILAWELANDPRCSSTLPSSPECNTHTITRWAADLAAFIKKLDSRHLVTAGDGGFYCVGCPKLFCPKDLWSRWGYSPEGPTFDGSFGVDTEDLISIPDIDFGSFQLFPDQIQYYLDIPDNQTIANIGSGTHWIIRHAETAKKFGKPEVLTAYQILSKDDLGAFVPFDATEPTPASLSATDATLFQRDFSMISYITTVYNDVVAGIIEFKWVPPSVRIVKRAPTDYPNLSQLGAALIASKNGM